MSEFEFKYDNEDIEIALFIEAIKQKYGYDFKEYSRAHIKRRVKARLFKSGISNISELTHLVIYKEEFFKEVLLDFSINVTEMFRDPDFFKSVRDLVFPVLESYPMVKIWHAGCSSGEEVYSMAIMLKEYGIYDRCQIYATDFNEKILKKAREGIYSLELMKEYTKNYIAVGGKESFSDYYIAKYDSVIFESYLKKNITFAVHNLVTDGEFGEMNLIVCRNVMIYFDKALQNKVSTLFSRSLLKGGYLCLGTKETLKYFDGYDQFTETSEESKIYRKNMKI
ncbi:MAG: protein-glutamate O-methyltransferase CheR [Acidaminobacteraceae bacterium]